MGIVLKNGLIVTQNEQRQIFQGDLLIEGDTITDISDQISGESHHEYDCTGLVIIPGLVQSHIHLCQTLFRNIAENLSLLEWLQKYIWPLEKAHSEESLRASVRLGLSELLLSGTTCILDMGSGKYQEVIFQEMAHSGMRGASGMVMMDQGDELFTTDTDHLLKQTENLIREWHQKENQRIQYALAPRFILSCSETLFKGVRNLAQKYDLIIHSHAGETRKEVDIVKQLTGKSHIRHFVDLGLASSRLCLAHCIWLSPEEKSLLSEYEINVLHCPATNLKLGSGIAPIPEYLNMQINVSLGSDGASCNNNLDMFNEMRMAALIQKPFAGVNSLSARAVFDMATVGGARSLGMSRQIGSLETGKKADLAILNLNKVHAIPADDIYAQIVYSARSTDVLHVMTDGQWRVFDQKLQIYEENEVIEQSWHYIYQLLDEIKSSET